MSSTIYLPNAEEPVTEQQVETGDPAATVIQDKYFLQAGSFQNAGDAENLKAKLAMLGVEAIVQDINLPEKGGVAQGARGSLYKRLTKSNKFAPPCNKMACKAVLSKFMRVQQGQ